MYRTIVADPPWPYAKRTPRNFACQRCGRWRFGSDRPGRRYLCRCGDPIWITRSEEMPYETMGIEDIAALPVTDFAEADAHLYLWTTQAFLREAYEVVEAWGFGSPSSVLVWSKSPKGLSRAAFVCSAEFVLFARRGTLASLDRHMGTVFDWPRQFLTGSGATHSAKPDAFLDLVERMSPGPYLEMFARRARFGWDYWGDESLQNGPALSALGVRFGP